MLEHCSNVIELTTMLGHKKLGMILLHMGHLQKLDIQWYKDVKQLFGKVGLNLKELTIRIDIPTIHTGLTKSLVHFWMLQNLNLVTSYDDNVYYGTIAIWEYWVNSNSK